ncbi:MAG: hypothetical protein ABIE68_04775 [bacterium]
MLKKILFFFAIAISSYAALYDYLYFYQDKQLAFKIHNWGSLLMGLILVFSAMILIKRREDGIVIEVFVLLIGLSMIVIHTMKLFVGVCI